MSEPVMDPFLDECVVMLDEFEREYRAVWRDFRLQLLIYQANGGPTDPLAREAHLAAVRARRNGGETA